MDRQGVKLNCQGGDGADPEDGVPRCTSRSAFQLIPVKHELTVRSTVQQEGE